MHPRTGCTTARSVARTSTGRRDRPFLLSVNIGESVCMPSRGGTGCSEGGGGGTIKDTCEVPQSQDTGLLPTKKLLAARGGGRFSMYISITQGIEFEFEWVCLRPVGI